MWLWLCLNTDVSFLLDVTKTWAETELQSEPCIVHMRYKAMKCTLELCTWLCYQVTQVHTCATLSHVLYRPWESKAVKITEDIDFGIVDDTELGQQVYQVRVHPRHGHMRVSWWHTIMSLTSPPLPYAILLNSSLPSTLLSRQQPWYRITQGHHPVDKATAAEVCYVHVHTYVCMCWNLYKHE